MSKKNIGKKILGIALLGAAVGGAIAFFRKFEKEQDDDFSENGFDECEDCRDDHSSEDEDQTRSYTTIAGEKEAEEKEEEKEEEAL